MAKFLSKAKLEMSATIELTESEIMALDALSGYGTDAFIKAFYKVMGETYMRPHEAGMRSLLDGVRGTAGHLRNHRNEVEKVWRGTHVATDRHSSKPAYEAS